LVPGEEAVHVTVTLIVPVWNQAGLLERLLDSIRKQTRQPEEVVIVDGASTDGAADAARNWGARVISLDRNRGFAAAVNTGIASCSTTWIGLINSDVELQPEWLENLLNAAEETGAGFACGKIFSMADRARLDGTWDLIATSGFPLRAGNGYPDSPEFASRRSIHLTSATATLYRRELFLQVGAFDEQYESYLEDVDFSLRCTVEGFRGVYEPTALAFHKGGGSGGRMVQLHARNQVWLIRKLYPAALERKFRSRILIGRVLWGALALRHWKFAAWLSGLRSSRRGRIEPAPLDGQKLENLLRESEREIQSLAGKDLYWRLYFLFTRGESR
jgi:GT2 family glycosyltransferase